MKSINKYRRSPKGVLTNMYDKMRGRREVEFSLKEFHDRFLEDKKYLRLHSEWVKSGYDKMKRPSLDRIKNSLGYTVKNTQMLTWGENRYKQSMERRSRKGGVTQYKDGEKFAWYKSQKEAVKATGIPQSMLSRALNSEKNTCRGFVFVYDSNIHEGGE